MKNILLILLISSISNAILGQSNTFPSTGNVGIGTTNPGAKLEVWSSALAGDQTALRLNNNYGYGSGLGTAATKLEFQRNNKTIATVIAGNEIETTSNSHYLTLSTFDTSLKERLRISSSGNVGIGTTNPGSKLEIWTLTQSGTQSALRLNNNYGYGGGVGIASSQIDFQRNGKTTAAITSGNEMETTSNSHYLTLSTFDTSLKERLRISSDGNVGIGITNPTEKLAVNGNIRAKEIKVEASPWPDYVFHKTYSLQPLSEVEKFIQTNQHLPGIPSASEVEKDGLNLGKMNAMLLKKIEEQTLYLIEISKMLNDQAKKNAEQQKEIDLLRSRK